MKQADYPVKSLTIAGVPVSEYVIVPGGTGHEQEAAFMLAEYLEKACGAFVPVRSGSSAKMPYEILVGKTPRDIPAVADRRAALKNDGVLFYLSDEKKLYLDSQSRLGVRYAVSKFLEKFVGVRFYEEQTERILPAESIDIPAGLDYSHSSPLLYRHTDWGITSQLRRKWGLNGEDGVENKIIGFCHTMGALTETPNDSQPCLSDEKVYETCLKNLKKWIEQNPGCRIVSVTQNDNDRFCTCPKCSALAEKENQSGVMLTFVNRLADAIREEYPDVYLLTFAYWYTRKPPMTIVPRDNVIIWLCSIECCFSHRLDDPTCAQNVEFHNDIVKWSQIAKKVYIWDYITNYAHYCLPFANFKTLLPNTKFFVDNHAVAIYEEGGYQQRENGEFRSLRAYLTAQMLWNPDLTQDEWNGLMDDFLEGYYGAGWKYIREYIDRICERAAMRDMRIYQKKFEILSAGPDKATDLAFCNEMVGLWDKACDMAETSREKQHCEASRTQMDLLRIIAVRAETDQIDVEGNRRAIAQLKKSGVIIVHEGGDPSIQVRHLDDTVAKGCTPNEWDVLSQREYREKWGITPLEELKD